MANALRAEPWACHSYSHSVAMLPRRHWILPLCNQKEAVLFSKYSHTKSHRFTSIRWPEESRQRTCRHLNVTDHASILSRRWVPTLELRRLRYVAESGFGVFAAQLNLPDHSVRVPQDGWSQFFLVEQLRMPLINCTECGARVSDAAQACIRCGFPLKSRQSSSREVAASTAASPNLFRCSTCGSEHVASVPLVVARGTMVTSSSTVSLAGGVIGAARGIGLGLSQSIENQVTQLAKQLAEPRPKTLATDGEKAAGCAAGCISVFVALPCVVMTLAGLGVPDTAGALLSLPLLIVVGSLVAIKVHSLLSASARSSVDEWNSAVYPELHAKWSRSFICMRCGCVTDPFDEDDGLDLP